MVSKKVNLSIVIPIYGCKTNIIELYIRLEKVLNKISPSFEIIFINDASPDGSWEIIVDIAQRDKRLIGINLSRNFGQHYAIKAGLDNCNGDYIIVMDCDLQDRPEEIEKFYNKAIEGYDVVLGMRKGRKDNFFKRNTSKLFFIAYNYLTEVKIEPGIGNFALYSRKVINEYNKIRERNQALILFAGWLGFNSTTIEIEHSERKHGKSSYNINKLLNLAINNIISQSNKPLRMFIKFGFSIATLSFIYSIYLITKKLIYGSALGWTSIMVAIFFIGGLLFANLGIVGLYLGRIFDELKNRPLYIISQTINYPNVIDRTEE
jgi:dolichol-phosphate mannosyltransferase